MIKRVIILLIIISISFSEQNYFDEISFNSESNKSYKISKISSHPIIDGLLEDAVWEGIPAITDFIQDEPFNMAIPTAKNEIKIAYDDQSIYIAARLLDISPDEITKHMARRDDWRKVMMSDWFSIEIDSYHDHQTAFEFLVNSMGTQFDDMIFDDSYRNTEWNAIWEAEVSSDERGWNVEMRIPFSVLRFSNNSEITMGINLNRYIQRKNELMSWVVFPRGQVGISSKFGHLKGIYGIEERNIPLSIKPYVTSGVYKYNHHHLVSRDIPQFDKENKRGDGEEYKLGMDIKYLITHDIINDIALNPDYGQIEADPADINITYFETYFVEKRPFFMENATLFDTPIEVFYSRRIGTNREYMMGNWQTQMNSIVKYAGKISGKNKNGLSFGVITAVTNDTIPSWVEFNSNSNFFVGRVTQDLFEGNSYIGFLSTIYNDSTETDYVNSIDMLSYLWDNQLVLDWQILNSQSNHSVDYNGVDGKSGNGLSFEMNYNPSKSNFYSFLDMEYFDKTLNINDVGYLYRNNLKKIQGGVGLYWPELDLPFPILEGKVNLKFNKMSNLKNLVLNNSLEFNSTITFDNFWYMGGGFNYIGEHYDDLLLYDYYSEEMNKKDRLGPHIMIPKGTEINVHAGNNPNQKYTINTNVSIWENDYEDGESQSISFGASISESTNFNIEYSQAYSDENYRWIEAYNKSPVEYIFASSSNQSQKYVYEINYNYNRETSIQLYAEYYSNYNNYGKFYKYGSDNMFYDIIDVSDYYYYSYDEDGSIIEGESDNPLNPQDHVYHYTKDHILNLNMVLNHEFRPGSNMYFVYSVYRDVVGKRMNDFTQFIKYVPSEIDLAEVNFTQSLYFKVDYWFDF